MIGISLLGILIGLGVVWWMLKRKHDETYMEILITYPFDSLKKGKTAIFKSGLLIKVGDFVLIHLPGYDMIWKVTKQEGDKLCLVNRGKEELTGFPSHYIWGKMIGYKGEMFEDDNGILVGSEFIRNVPDYAKGILNKKNNKENKN